VLLQVGQVAPVQDYIDSDKLIKYLVDTTGIPASVIRSDEEVAQIRRQQQQQQEQQGQQQQQMEMAQQAQMVAPLVKAVS
jgi:hypothetical protein